MESNSPLWTIAREPPLTSISIEFSRGDTNLTFLISLIIAFLGMPSSSKIVDGTPPPHGLIKERFFQSGLYLFRFLRGSGLPLSLQGPAPTTNTLVLSILYYTALELVGARRYSLLIPKPSISDNFSECRRERTVNSGPLYAGRTIEIICRYFEEKNLRQNLI